MLQVSILAAIRHPNVAMLMGLCLHPICVVTEFCARGSLSDVLQMAASNADFGQQLDWRRRLTMALDAAKVSLSAQPCLSRLNASAKTASYTGKPNHSRSIFDKTARKDRLPLLSCLLICAICFLLCHPVSEAIEASAVTARMCMSAGYVAAAQSPCTHPTPGPQVSQPAGGQALACQGH